MGLAALIAGTLGSQESKTWAEQTPEKRAVVIYSREAFVYAPGGVRVNIDRDLRRCLDAREFLNPRRFGVPADGGFDLLEVKYGAFLPDVARMAVQTAACGRSAFSKYAECRRFE